MFEALAKEISELGGAAREDNVRDFVRLREQYDSAGATLIAEFEASGEWASTGAVSIRQWLTTQCRLSREEAQRLRALGRCVGLFPATAAAFQCGDLSSAQVCIIGANVPSELEWVFAEREADLVPHLIPLSARDTVRVMKRWKQVACDEFDLGEPPAEPEASHIRFTQTSDDGWTIGGTTNNADGQIINSALWRALTDDVAGTPARTHAQRVGDALTDICRRYLTYDDRPISPRRQPHVTVEMTVAEFESRTGSRYQDRTPVDPTTLVTTMCTAEFSRVLREGSVILDYGRAIQAVPDALRKVVIHRDQHCRFGTCDRPPQWCDTHHHRWWSQGGKRTLEPRAAL